MNSCYGYADDYKVVGTNTFTLQIDASRIWQWCSKNMMRLNLAECRLLSITGKANAQLGGRFLEKAEFEKDLGIVVSSDLSWTTQAEKSRKSYESLLEHQTKYLQCLALDHKEEPLPQLRCSSNFIRIIFVEGKQTSEG